MSGPSFLDVLDEVVADVVGPGAASTDAGGVFPRNAVTALGERGLLGLMSLGDVGGALTSHEAAITIVEETSGRPIDRGSSRRRVGGRDLALRSLATSRRSELRLVVSPSTSRAGTLIGD